MLGASSQLSVPTFVPDGTWPTACEVIAVMTAIITSTNGLLSMIGDPFCALTPDDIH
jgi:hypothetical protein